jgi:hypothetical protein
LLSDKQSGIALTKLIKRANDDESPTAVGHVKSGLEQLPYLHGSLALSKVSPMEPLKGLVGISVFNPELMCWWSVIKSDSRLLVGLSWNQLHLEGMSGEGGILLLTQICLV